MAELPKLKISVPRVTSASQIPAGLAWYARHQRPAPSNAHARKKTDCRDVCGGTAKLDVCGECEGEGDSCAGSEVFVFPYGGTCKGRTPAQKQKIEQEVKSEQEAALDARSIEYKSVFAATQCSSGPDDELMVNLTVTRDTPELSDEERTALTLSINEAAGESAVLASSNSFALSAKNIGSDGENNFLLWIILAAVAAVALIASIVGLFFALRSQVYVKLPSGRLERLNVNLNATVWELKKKLSKKKLDCRYLSNGYFLPAW